MLSEIKGAFDKLNKDKIILGYDLGDEFSQISYYRGGEEHPETLSLVAGAEQFLIPTVLCKRHEVNQWFYGKDAIKNIQNGEGIPVSNLVSLAKAGEPVWVEDLEFDPVDLLALFIRRTLSLLAMITSTDKIAAFMITVPELDAAMIGVLNQVVKALHLDESRVYFQSYAESVYYFMLHQPKELWNQQVLICNYDRNGLSTYRMRMNYQTVPVVTFVERQTYSQLPYVAFRGGEGEESVKDELDKDFLRVMLAECKESVIASVYLIGEGFEGEWAKESLRYLCKGRRVFQGNNLFSKGACYSAKEKLMPSPEEKKYVLLGQDKLKANMGMHVIRDGEEVYMALLDAGINWYEAAKECDFILESGSLLEIVVTPLNGENIRTEEIQLNGLPSRPKKATRLRMKLHLTSENEVEVKVIDMGFGEMFPASGKEWIETFQLM